jgi:hypothetical protein
VMGPPPSPKRSKRGVEAAAAKRAHSEAVGDVDIVLPDCCGGVSCHGNGPDCLGKVWEMDPETKQMPASFVDHIKKYHLGNLRKCKPFLCRPCADKPYIWDEAVEQARNRHITDTFENVEYILPIYGKPGKFDQHSPHCPGGCHCIGAANGLTQSLAGYCREAGVVVQKRIEYDLETVLEGGAAFDGWESDAPPGCVFSPDQLTMDGIWPAQQTRCWPVPSDGDGDPFQGREDDHGDITLLDGLLREWRDGTREMYEDGTWSPRPGLPDRTYKKQRADSQLLVEERELPRLRSDDSGACGSPEADRLGDFE